MVFAGADRRHLWRAHDRTSSHRASRVAAGSCTGAGSRAAGAGRKHVRALGASVAARRHYREPFLPRGVCKRRGGSDLWFRPGTRDRASHHRSGSQRRAGATDRRCAAGRRLGRPIDAHQSQDRADLSRFGLSVDRREPGIEPRRGLLRRSDGPHPARPRAQRVSFQRLARVANAAFFDQADVGDGARGSRTGSARAFRAAGSRAGRPADGARRTVTRTGTCGVRAASARLARRRPGRSRSPNRGLLRAAGIE